MEMLSVKQVAELKGCDERTVRRHILGGLIDFVEAEAPGNKLKEYRIPIAALEPRLQQRYYGEMAVEISPLAPPRQAARALEQYSAEDRAAIQMWSQVLQEWQRYRNDPAQPSKTEVDKLFVAMMQLKRPELPLSTGTLYRKWAALKAGDMDGLIDKRGQWRCGQYEMHPRLWEMFQDFYLDQRQFPIAKCVEYVRLWAQEYYPELVDQMPSYHSFRRRLMQELPKAVVEMGRNGDKAYADRCAPFVDRYYDDLESNEYWIADNHTFDILTQNGDGKPHRMYLTAFIDARSGIFTGWCVTDAPSSDSTLLALRHGILRCGIPRFAYLDNGREFLNKDIGGLGHRQKKSTKGEYTPPPIFERLGITMVNAIVRNAKAKPIERTFGDVKNIISRTFSTYTGGNVLEKPGNLKQRLKEGVPLDQELRAAVDAILDGYYNMGEYNGKVKADQGKSRIQVFNDNLRIKRTATAEDLNLLLMRTTKPQTIGRNGVHITLFGEKIFFWNEWTHFHQDQKVYVRFDPADLQEVRIYDAETDQFLQAAPMHRDFIARFGLDKDTVANAMRRERQTKRATKTLLDSKRCMTPDERIDALSLTIRHSDRNRAKMEIGRGKALEPVRANERSSPLMAANGGIVIDQAELNRKTILRRKDNGDS